MTYDEALDVFELVILWEDQDCFCYKNSKCERCTKLPSIEDIKLADSIILGGKYT